MQKNIQIRTPHACHQMEELLSLQFDVCLLDLQQAGITVTPEQERALYLAVLPELRTELLADGSTILECVSTKGLHRKMEAAIEQWLQNPDPLHRSANRFVRFLEALSLAFWGIM